MTAEVEFDPFAGQELARVVPTTEPQREVWLADQLGREASLAFNESVAVRFCGALNVAALQSVLTELAQRHESLRASFSDDGSEMLIMANGDVQCILHDLANLSETERQVRLFAARRRAVDDRYDLTSGPLARAELLRFAPDDHVLIFGAHHIVCDGWSFGVLLREIAGLYSSRIGHPREIAEPVSFADYALQLRSPEAESRARKDEEHWVRLFDRHDDVTELPNDHPRPARRRFESRRVDFTIPADHIQALRVRSANLGVSLFSTMFGSFAACVARYCRNNEPVIGVPTAGQMAADSTALVGHCVNLLPIRVALGNCATASDVISVAQSAVLDAFEHQSCTFGALLQKLTIQRDPARLPLVSLQFNLDSRLADSDLQIPGLTVSYESIPRNFENFELFVNATQSPTGMVLECQYSTALFEDSSIARLMEYYIEVLGRFQRDPAQSSSDLLALSAHDLADLQQANRTDRARDTAANIMSLVAQQAELTPDRQAIVGPGTALTYAQLESRVSVLARRLRDLGAAPGALIGLLLSRDACLQVAQLAVLRTGAAYVPLDPSFPKDRLAFMAEDAALHLLITQDALLPKLGFPADRSIFVTDGGELFGANNPNAILLPGEVPIAAGSPAYVIYTSGSTGKPKGVVVKHGGVANFARSMTREPGLTADDVIVAVTTPSFDIAVLELLVPLTVGAKVVIASREQTLDGSALYQLLKDSCATVLQATPATWRVLLDAGWPGARKFKALIGGEALPLDLAQRLAACTDELYNMYGPTETTIWSTIWRVPTETNKIRIGQPIDNTQILVVDSRGEICPTGVPGELWIGGAGVAQGYWHRPDLTTDRFVTRSQPPFAGRFYRTGDLGRWCGDGLLEHLGRLDLQVKVRGFRIELGDIEANLQTCSGVAQCAVIVREDAVGDARIFAYVVTTGGAPNFDQLKSELRGKLPEYMLPQNWVTLQSLPLTPNGKIDRKALPKPATDTMTRASSSAVRPNDPLELGVLQAFEEVLRLRQLGMDDEFFALGGHSLLAARLSSLLNRSFDIALPMIAVFESTTPRAMVARIRAAQQGNTQSQSVSVEHLADQSCGPLTVGQARIRFMEEMYPGRVVYNTPSAHRLRGDFDCAAFQRAFAGVVADQPSLRTVIGREPGGTRFQQLVLDDVPSNIARVDLRTVPADSREAELMRRMQAIIDTPIDISAAPLFRVALYVMADDEHVFLFMPHHVIWDGWSFDLLYAEIATRYVRELRGGAAQEPAQTISYVDFARWQERWLQSADADAQRQYWKRRFRDVPLVSPLPTDRPRLAGMTGVGSVEWIHVDAPLTENLRVVARQFDATLNMLAMAVYCAMLSEVRAGIPVVVGVPVRGRVQPEFDAVMGFFNNLLPVPLTVDPSMTMSALVDTVKRELIGAFANQSIPFEILASEPEFVRLNQGLGLYQSLFSFQDARDRIREWGPLRHQSVLVMQKGATEDFGVWLMEVPNGLEGGVNYNADIFDQRTAQIFRARLLDLFATVVANPQASVAELLAKPTEASHAFHDWLARHGGKERVAPPAQRQQSAAVTQGQTPPQQALASIWADLLGIDAQSIAPTDNFFDLGGNSLLAMQAIDEAAARLNLSVDPRRYLTDSLALLAEMPIALPDAVTGALAELRRIWAELLGIAATDISPGDNFFDLGGNSLLAMRALELGQERLHLTIEARRYLTDSLQQLAATTRDPGTSAATTRGQSASRQSVFGKLLGRLTR